jgi:hypothetical protein
MKHLYLTSIVVAYTVLLVMLLNISHSSFVNSEKIRGVSLCDLSVIDESLLCFTNVNYGLL